MIYRCSCTDGWIGVDCEDDVDECLDSEGKLTTICNNGICVNKVGYFQCFCRPGFTGSSCDHNFNECLSNPCKNGGTCEDKTNEYRCSCLPGFEGML